MNGCASSGPGGGSSVRSDNRLEATLTVQGTLNQNFYYGVAFDDQGDGEGPAAVDSNSPVVNGVVDGNFRLLVLFNRGRFRVFYRSDPEDRETEREVDGQALFINTERALTNGINFTIDLDAVLDPSIPFDPTNPDNGRFFFPHTTRSINDSTPVLLSNSTLR